MKKQISYKIVSLVFSILVLCFAIAFYAVGWTEPSTSPPAGNVDAPLNTGNTTQYKSGALGVGGLFQTNNETHLAILGGNVGIGTESPVHLLHIVETQSPNSRIRIDNAFAGGGNGDSSIVLSDAAAGSPFDNRVLLSRLKNTHEYGGGLLLQNWKDGGCVGRYFISEDGDHHFGDGEYPMEDSFVVMKNNGNVGIGTTTPTEKLNVNGNILVSGTVCDSNGCIGGGVVGSGDITDVTGGNAITSTGSSGPTPSIAVTLNSINDDEILDNSLTAGSLAANSCGNSELIDSPTFTRVTVNNAPTVGTDATNKAYVDAQVSAQAAICTWSGVTYSTGAKCQVFYTSSSCRQYACLSNGSWLNEGVHFSYCGNTECGT